MATLSAADLRSVRSCNGDLANFIDLFGEAGGEVTFERVMQGALTFDWLRAAELLLNDKQKQHFRVLMLNSFRGLNRVQDPDKSKRRTALAKAFYTAFNSPKE